MKLTAQTGEIKSEVQINRDGSKLFAEVDGREYELEASSPEPNIYLLKHKGSIYEVFVSPGTSSDTSVQVKLKNQEFDISITDPKKLRGTGADDSSAEGMSELRTAMPGKVVRILLEKGAEVSKGDGIIVVEAMKMQNEMKAPRDGTIIEILFNEGDTVNAGDVLAIIE